MVHITPPRQTSGGRIRRVLANFRIVLQHFYAINGFRVLSSAVALFLSFNGTGGCTTPSVVSTFTLHGKGRDRPPATWL
ncbi:hypothetical protein KCP73_08545 [Salmonella enterica subsp. enterica]|nr:hypothetical protein KCP73_08545 [Salmonella enterica subsp. enterica]